MIGDEKQGSTVTDSSCTLLLSLTLTANLLHVDSPQV